MVEKLVPDLFIKNQIEHISGSTARNVIQFPFILCLSEGLPKYIKTKVLTTYFDHI